MKFKLKLLNIFDNNTVLLCNAEDSNDLYSLDFFNNRIKYLSYYLQGRDEMNCKKYQDFIIEYNDLEKIIDKFTIESFDHFATCFGNFGYFYNDGVVLSHEEFMKRKYKCIPSKRYFTDKIEDFDKFFVKKEFYYLYDFFTNFSKTDKPFYDVYKVDININILNEFLINYYKINKVWYLGYNNKEKFGYDKEKLVILNKVFNIEYNDDIIMSLLTNKKNVIYIDYPITNDSSEELINCFYNSKINLILVNLQKISKDILLKKAELSNCSKYNKCIINKFIKKYEI